MSQAEAFKASLVGRVPSPEEVEAMEKAADSLRDGLLVRVMARSGLRVHELTGIELRDLDLSQTPTKVVVRTEAQGQGEGGGDG